MPIFEPGSFSQYDPSLSLACYSSASDASSSGPDGEKGRKANFKVAGNIHISAASLYSNTEASQTSRSQLMRHEVPIWAQQNLEKLKFKGPQ